MKTDYSTEFLELVEDMKKDHIMLLTPIASIAGYYLGKGYITPKDVQILLEIECKIMDGYVADIKKDGKRIRNEN